MPVISMFPMALATHQTGIQQHCFTVDIVRGLSMNCVQTKILPPVKIGERGEQEQYFIFKTNFY